MQRSWIIAGSSLLTVAVLLSLFAGLRREPVYAGKTASQWLNQGYEDAAHAIHEMGPAALPYVLAKIAHEDPTYGKNRQYR